VKLNGNGKRPDYIVKVGIKGQPYHKRVGAAWRIQGGRGLSIKLDPGIALVGATDVSITIWPNDEAKQQPSSNQTSEYDYD
jgi:hypothetical protein